MTSPFHRLHVTQVASMKEDLSSSGIMRESSPLSSSPSSSSTPSASFVTSSTSSTEASTPDAEGEVSPQRSPAHHPSDDQQGILIHSEQVEHIHHDDHEHEHDPENAAAQSESTAISSSIPSSSSSSSLSNPSDDRCTLRLLIDNSQVGAIIGAKGASIARVRAHSGACVTILKHPHPHPHPRASTSPTDSPSSTTSSPSYIHERILVLKGQRSNLPKAIQLIAQDILNAARERGSVKDAYTNVQQGTTKIVILVNKSVVGCILGKGGESIRITTISTHTRIEISHHALPYSNEKSVTIYGSPYALASAVNIILQQLYEFHTRMGISFTTSHPYVPGTHARVATSTTAHPQQSHFPQQEYEAKDDHILLNEVDQQLNEATLRRSSASSLGDEYIYTATATTTTASTPLHPHHHTHHHPHLHHQHHVHFPPTASAAYSSSSMSSSYASTPSYSAASFSSSPFSSSPSTPRSHHEYIGEYSTSAQAQPHTPMMMMTMMPHTPQSPQTLLLTPSTTPPSTTMNMLAAAGGLPPLSAATTLVYQQEVSIPIEVAIHLLSKGGEVLKELRASTGCMISVSDPRVPSAFWAAEERLLTIIGTQQGIWMAICIIKQLINEYQHQQQQQQQQRTHSQQLQQQQQQG